MIKADKLSKGYNGDAVLKSVSAELDSGTVYGLIGSNAAGKTTLIKCLAGIYRPDTGEITLDGNLIYDNADTMKRIAYIEDNPCHINSFTVKRMGDYYGNFYDDYVTDRFNKLAYELSLDLKAHIGGMSLGQKKKLSFALAFAREAEYILLDEPENGLDNEARIVIRRLIREAADRGASILISSHDLTNVEDMCDKVIMLDEGQIIYNGTIDDILSGLSKWVIRSLKTDIPDIVVLQSEDDIKTIVIKKDKEDARRYFESHGIETINTLRVELIDAYMMYKVIE